MVKIDTMPLETALCCGALLVLWPDVYDGLFTVAAVSFLTAPGYPGLEARLPFGKQLG